MSFADPKLLAFLEAPAVLSRLREQGKSIVQCHGTFDMLHFGHVVHLEEARALGDILVVTLTGEEYVDKGPGRPVFNDHMRGHFLAALNQVDYVIVVPHRAAVEAIECVRPDVYCKGKDYEDAADGLAGNIRDDVDAVKRLGGRVAYVGSITFSSTRLLNRHFPTYDTRIRGFLDGLVPRFAPSDFVSAIESFHDLRVLVIGDTIFDIYTTVGMQGLTSKDRILSGRFLGEEVQPGGALAIYRHVRQFTPHVKLISVTGVEERFQAELIRHLRAADDLVLRHDSFTTVVKQRFVEPKFAGNEMSKLFAVNILDDASSRPDVEGPVLERVADSLDHFDLVLVADFGHGLLTEKIRRVVEERASFLGLNCQTNSFNHGFNVINRQYRRANAFSLDQAELTLAVGERDMDFERELGRLRAAFGAKYAWLTRGGIETIGLGDEEACYCPALEVRIVDTIGAGDAFFALACLCAVRSLPVDFTTFVAQLAGAQAVRFAGNARPIEKASILKAGSTMLSI